MPLRKFFTILREPYPLPSLEKIRVDIGCFPIYNGGTMDEYIEVGIAELCGCYLLLWKGEVVYVGRAENILQRLCAHRYSLLRYLRNKHVGLHQKVIRFDRIRFAFCTRSEMDRRERELIVQYRPRYNTQHIPRRQIDIEALIAKAGLEKEDWAIGLGLADASEKSLPSLRRF
jgi:hypothetical protein